ncbi:isochorismatase [Prevotella sp. HMSC069G02]|nr:isochorismatase [Prevotella sp. HMSC069G02]
MKWRYFAQNTAKLINIAYNKGQHKQANDFLFAPQQTTASAPFQPISFR